MNRSNIYSIIHLSISFLLIFTSYGVTQAFQTSSTHAKHGAFAVGIIYLLFCLSNAGLSSYLIGLLGVRLTLILASLTYVAFVAANIHSNIWTLYICAVLLGFGAALLWTAQGVYVTVAMHNHEKNNNLVPSSTRGFMNGIFFSILQLSQIIGNSTAALLFCLKFDDWIIFTVMTAIAGLGAFILIFIRSVKLPKTTEKRTILSSLSILLDIRFLLLIPILCYFGLAQGFIFATVPPLINDKVRKFFMLALFGGVSTFSSLVFGKLSDLLCCRLIMFVIGALSQLTSFGLLLMIWKPSFVEDRFEIFIIIVIGLSIGDSIFSTLIYSVVGILYGETRPADAFACSRIFLSGCTAIGFVEHIYLTIPIQILFLVITMSCSLVILTYEHHYVVSLDTGKLIMTTEKQNTNGIHVDSEEQIRLTSLSDKA